MVEPATPQRNISVSTAFLAVVHQVFRSHNVGRDHYVPTSLLHRSCEIFCAKFLRHPMADDSLYTDEAT